MPKRSPNYAIVLTLLVVSLCSTYWARTRPAIALNGADLGSLPTKVGTWAQEGPDVKPGKEAISGWSIRPDDFLLRTYVSPDGVPVELMVIYKGLDRRGWHMSEMCFTGSGLNVRQSNTTVPYAGSSVRAVKLVAEDERTGSSMVTVYLLVQGKHTETNYLKQQLVMSLSRLRPSNVGWAYVRVTCPISTTEGDAMREIRGFLRQASGPLLKALSVPPRQTAG